MVEHHVLIERNLVLVWVAAWLNLNDIIPGKESQAPETTCCLTLSTCSSRKSKTPATEITPVVPRGWRQTAKGHEEIWVVLEVTKP